MFAVTYLLYKMIDIFFCMQYIFSFFFSKVCTYTFFGNWTHTIKIHVYIKKYILNMAS